MPTVLGPFLLAFVLAVTLVPACRWLARRLGYVAQPRPDRWHREPVALFGGVAIAAAVFGGAAMTGIAQTLPVLVGGAAVIFLLGLVDDILSLKPSTKLLVELVIASGFLFFGYRLNWVESLTLDSLLTIVWLVGMTNAFNLLDNMDGLCAGIGVIVGVALLADLWPAAAGTAAYSEAQWAALLLGATGGFLLYNFHPASIFMGDSGSLLLGLTLGALPLSAGEPNLDRSNVLSIIAAPVLVLLVPIFDTALVTVSRTLSGRSASVGGRDHTSHRLVAIGLSERTAVLVLWVLAAVGGLIGLAVSRIGETWSGPLAVIFLLGMVIFAVYLARIRVYEDDATELREGRVTPLVANFMYKRRVAEVMLDFCLVVIAYYGAYRFRFEDPEEFMKNFRNFGQSLPVVLGSQLAAFFVVGVYRGVWRHFGLMDAVVVGKGVLAGAVTAQLVILYLYRFFSYSRTVFAIYAVLLLALVVASRASFRLIGEFVHRRRVATDRLLIYRSGDEGGLALRELLNDSNTAYRMLGFVDDDPQSRQTRVHGYPVLGGYDYLVSQITGHRVDIVIVSGPRIDPGRVRDLAAICASHHVALSRLHVDLEPLVVAVDAAGVVPKLRPLAARPGRRPDA